MSGTDDTAQDNISPHLKTWKMLSKEERKDPDVLRAALQKLEDWVGNEKNRSTKEHLESIAAIKDRLVELERAGNSRASSFEMRTDPETSKETTFIVVPARGEDQEDTLKKVCDFVIHPIRRETSLDGTGQYYVCLFNNGKTISEQHIAMETFADLRTFRKHHCSVDFNFFGAEKELFELNSKVLSDYEMPLVYSTNQIGMTKQPGTDKWAYVSEKGVVDCDGKVVDTLALNDCDVPEHMRSVLTPLAESTQQADAALLDFNTPQVVARLLGWTAATFFKQRLRKVKSQFPILHPVGAAGSGKTTEMTLVKSIWGIRNDVLANFYSETPFVRQKKLACSTLVPIVWDEVRPGSVQQKIEMWRNLVLGVYDSQVGGKGTKDLRITHYRQDAPVIGLSETSIGGQAVADRTLSVDFNVAGSKEHQAQWEQISKNDLSWIGGRLLYFAMTMSDDDIAEQILTIEQGVRAQLRDRQRWNVAVAGFGLVMLGEVTGLDISALLNALLKSAKVDATEHIEDSYAKQVIIDWLTMATKEGDVIGHPKYTWQDHLINKTHYVITNDQIRFRVALIWPRYEAWRTRTNRDILLSRADFDKQIKHETFFDATKSTGFGGGTQHCLCVERHPFAEQCDALEAFEVELKGNP